MFNFFKPTSEATFERLLNNFWGTLKKADTYLAHKSHKKGQIDETLPQHITLVVSYEKDIIKTNGLDCAIDSMIEEIVKMKFEESNFEAGFIWLKDLFFKTILFHDHGKINMNFQGLEKKMNNVLYRSRLEPKSPIDSQHSKPGAFIFLIAQFDAINNSSFSGKEKRFLHIFSILFSYNILKHHAPYLNQAWEVRSKFSLEEVNYMKAYLDEYQMTVKPVFRDQFCEVLKKFEESKSKVQTDFSVLALLRLNFSLLTASDYLATSDYMSQTPITELGVMSEELRNRIIENSRNSEKYNQKAFEKADLLRGGLLEDLPTEKSGDNLNDLRKRMAAEAINTVRDNADKRLFYLEAPTGGGKTNISMLVAAELLNKNPELNKVFYVFPFTTLITQTHKTILKTWNVSTDEVALMHSKAGFQSKNQSEEEDLERDADYGKDKKNYLNNLFAFYPICLTTHIRFFDILKSNDKETIYLMHRLANSIVILDELQSYNPAHWDKMMYIIDNYARLFNIRFVLMSATLPKIDKLKLPLTQRPHFTELLPDAKRFFTNPNFSERVQFDFSLIEKYKPKIKLDDLATEVIEKSEIYVKTEGAVHTIIEFIFKKSATQFKEVIENLEHPFEHIFVLSGTILEPRRREIINFLKNKEQPKQNTLLITTQVVEAGVDIDMDLGFKNVSLIDSDEQLAGRVNRNVNKKRCTVYLFKKDDASMLYKSDYRFTAMRDKITPQEHENILLHKNFEKLYNEVLLRIDKQNADSNFVNFNNDYLPYVQNLDFKQVNEKFRLIDTNNVSIFVPVNLVIRVEGEKHTADTPQYEDVFSKNELKFLKKSKLFSDDDTTVSGKNVWLLYRDLIENRRPDFTEQVVSMKTIQGILSKFTFSIFYTDALEKTMTQFIDKELGFEKYWYLSHYKDVYNLESGLMTDRFNDSEHSIL